MGDSNPFHSGASLDCDWALAVMTCSKPRLINSAWMGTERAEDVVFKF
jgi:hypothetical protein